MSNVFFSGIKQSGILFHRLHIFGAYNWHFSYIRVAKYVCTMWSAHLFDRSKLIRFILSGMFIPVIFNIQFKFHPVSVSAIYWRWSSLHSRKFQIQFESSDWELRSVCVCMCSDSFNYAESWNDLWKYSAFVARSLCGNMTLTWFTCLIELHQASFNRNYPITSTHFQFSHWSLTVFKLCFKR